MKSWHTDNQAMSVTRDRAGLSRLRLESQDHWQSNPLDGDSDRGPAALAA